MSNISYDNETYEKILERMLDALPNDIDKRQGSIVFDLLAPAAYELSLAYTSLENILQYGVVNLYMPSEYLDLRVGEIGMNRRPSVQAEGVVVLNGSVGTVIPANTRVSTEMSYLPVPVYFTTKAEVVIGDTGTVNAEVIAEEGGTLGNIDKGQIVHILGDLAGVVTVNNPDIFAGGVEVEDDTELIIRYLEKVRRPITSGNANQYHAWAREVSGVGGAKVYDADNINGKGAGSVRIIIIDENKQSKEPNISILVDNVKTYIESLRPIGATVYVEPAIEVPIDVSFTITLENGYTLSEVKPKIESELDTYLAGLAFNDPIVRLSKIQNLVLDTEGVLDYQNMIINGNTSNVVIPEGQIAVRGVVNF